MFAHAARNAPPRGRSISHVTAVADVSSAAGLIWPHIVGAENHAVLFGHERFLVVPHPVGRASASLIAGSSVYVVPSRMIGMMIAATALASLSVAFRIFIGQG